MTVPSSRLRLRAAVPGDAAALCALSVAAVREAATGHYTPDQLDAWAARRTVGAHRSMIERTATWVAVAPDGIAGFVCVALVPTDALVAGEVDQLYVAPAHIGRGVGRLLLSAAERSAREAGLDRLVTHASWRAAPVFERCGFERVELETVELDGEALERLVMRKDLGAAATTSSPPPSSPPS